jgi:uncharacterized membrane protein (DUF4010 family)
MIDQTLVWSLFTALLIGLIIGLEREIAQEQRQDVKFAGLRTFGIVGLMGGICAYMAVQDYFVFIAALLAITALTCVAYYKATEISKHLGFTTEMALLLTFLLGGLAYFQLTIAVILAIIITVLLAFKEPLHQFTFKIPIKEFYDSLKFALIAIVVLPVLYYQFNQGYGPLGAFNPYQVWLFVVILSGISFVGYFLVKWFGTDLGLVLTGFLGGLASSTAVTTAMAMRTKEVMGIEHSARAASMFANAVMFMRVLLLIFLLYPSLALRIYLPLGVMFVTSTLVASYFYIKGRGAISGGTIKLNTPFSIEPALIFATFLTAILFLSKATLIYLGSAGLYVTSLVSALVDVNPIVISTSQLALNGLASTNVAVIAIMLAVFVNMAVQIVYAFYFGTRKFGLYTLYMASIVIISGILTLLLIV